MIKYKKKGELRMLCLWSSILIPEVAEFTPDLTGTYNNIVTP